MCGIHGFINGSTKADNAADDFVRSGFITNMLRGTDSSGIACVNANGNYDMSKLPLPGMHMTGNKSSNQLISRARNTNTATICHVRAATVGEVIYDNAHPFVVEDEEGNVVVGVHNGTLQNWRTKPEASYWDVDSGWAMARLQSEKADAFEEFMGAFAFVWWDSRTPKLLNMARNSERTLYVAHTEDGNLVYASEAGMIHWLCERHRIKLKGAIKDLEPGHMYQFDINKPTEFNKTKLPTYVHRSTYSSTSYSSSYSSTYGTHRSTVEKLDVIFNAIREEEDSVKRLSSYDKDTKRKTNATIEEAQDAYSMNLLGSVGTFTAMGSDDESGNLYGSFVADDVDGETHAVMRNVPDDIDWVTGGEWKVRVEGAHDSGREFLLIVSQPIEEEEAA